jgi:hypothetical protein
MSNSPTSKRSIRFTDDDELCIYHEGAVMDIKEVCKSDIWYQHAEMSRMKRRAAQASKEAHQCGIGSLLTNTYGKTCDATQDALNTWSRTGNSRRGLERWINDEYAANRADIRRRTIRSVLRAQDKMREENLTEPDSTLQVLSTLSETFSRDSTKFARALGIADELAIGEQIQRPLPKLFVPVPRTKSPKSPNSVIDFPNTNSRYARSTLELPFDHFVEQCPFFL